VHFSFISYVSVLSSKLTLSPVPLPGLGQAWAGADGGADRSLDAANDTRAAVHPRAALDYTQRPQGVYTHRHLRGDHAFQYINIYVYLNLFIYIYITPNDTRAAVHPRAALDYT